MPGLNNKERIENVTNQLINATNTVNNLPNYINTTDATALANEILINKTAYVNEVKITGTINLVNSSNIFVVNSSNLPIINGSNVELSYVWNYDRTIVDNGFRLNTYTPASNLANTLNITANNLAVGFNTLGIEGTYTSDANALNNQILENYTAYVNGTKLTGTYVPVMNADEYNNCLNITNNILD